MFGFEKKEGKKLNISMEEKEMLENKYKKKKSKVVMISKIILCIIIALLFILSFIFKDSFKLNKKQRVSDPELARAMTYERFQDGDDDIEGTDNVKFSAFFLRDLDGDGYAEKIKGTCREIGQSDMLYMEVIVSRDGYLRDAKIQIDGKNFNLQTALPKDNELKSSYIGNNTKLIEFNNLNNGMEKLLSGNISSDAIGDNINNYSRSDNKIILTGTHVAGNGTETEIYKEINLATDWYGTTEASIDVSAQNYYDINDRLDNDNETITLSFDINTSEDKNELLIKENYVQGVVPELNGYSPISVTLVGGNAEFSYNENTREFEIVKSATVDDNGNITKFVNSYQKYKMEVVYPLDAYSANGSELLIIRIPVSTYFDGYNNQNDEFDNPYRSNIAQDTLLVSYAPNEEAEAGINIKVGKYITYPGKRYLVSKQKALDFYNGANTEQSDDYYNVLWSVSTAEDAVSKIVLKETENEAEKKADSFIKADSTEDSMEDVTTNVGIYFVNANEVLGSDGEIKIYDDDSGELIHTFDSSEWGNYSINNPYMYENDIKHIKVVTTAANTRTTLYVYNIKKLDDEKIFEKYTREEFNNLHYIKSNLVGYFGDDYLGTSLHVAEYEEPFSLAYITVSKYALSTQQTENGWKVFIETTGDTSQNQAKWKDGEFIVELPKDILEAKINSVTVNSSDVDITSYEVATIAGKKVIRIKTANDDLKTYKITVDMNITPDPRGITKSDIVHLHYINGGGNNYYYSEHDYLDIDYDENVDELIGHTDAYISLVALNSLLTCQTITEYDDLGSEAVSPQIANLTPIHDGEQGEKQTAKIGMHIKNNYSNNVSEIVMMGKIPFEGNTYLLSNSSMGSEFSTTMTSAGIVMPEELQDKVTIYYSSNENPSKDLSDPNNGWTLKENVSDWTSIKSWLIDFGDFEVEYSKEYDFYYTLEIPEGVELNKVAYSHHGIYFSLNTPEGKYSTQTQPDKIGLRVAEKYQLQINKYLKGEDNLIPGATYKVSRLDDSGNIEDSQTAITNSNGSILMDNLYAENVYEVQEIQSPRDFLLNNDVVKFIVHADSETGVMTAEKISGNIRDTIQVVKNAGEEYRAIINVEDEALLKVKLTKYEKGTLTPIKGVRYNIKGEGLNERGVNYTTDSNGIITISGLMLGEEYTLTEVKADGYYLENPIVFRVSNNGNYQYEIINGSIKQGSVVVESNKPVLNIDVEDEKIPQFNLIINKVEKGTDVHISGAKFKLYRNNILIKEYITDENGIITIDNLYQYNEGKDFDATYTLKETYAPDGYAKTKNISFKVKDVGGSLNLISNETDNYTVNGSTITLTIEDNPSFKLIKKDGETSQLLPNVKFAIYNMSEGGIPATNSKGETIGTREIINGNEYYVVTTDANGELTAELADGIYKAVELEADGKYDISENTQLWSIGEKEKSQIMAAKGIVLGGDADDTITALTATSDGGFLTVLEYRSSNVVVGEESYSYDTGDMGFVVIKYNSDKKIEWSKGFSSYITSIGSACETTNGDYLLLGHSWSGQFYEDENEIIDGSEWRRCVNQIG